MRRRGFVAWLLGLAALPFSAKFAVASPAEAPGVLGCTETSIIDENQALTRARAWVKGVARVQLYVPTYGVYDHDPPSEYFFFWVDRGDHSYVGGAETVAVRKCDGRISHCGWIGE